MDLQGHLQEYSIGVPDIETSFETLSTLVLLGCLLTSVKLDTGMGSPTCLPIDAFDGQPMKEPLQRLQQQWEAALSES